MSTETVLAASDGAAASSRSRRMKSDSAPPRPRGSGIGIFDDPDHRWKVLSLVDKRNRGDLGFNVLYGDVERARVEGRSIRPGRVEHEREYRKSDGRGDPNPPRYPRGAPPRLPALHDPGAHPRPHRIESGSLLPCPYPGQRAQHGSGRGERRILRGARGTPGQVVDQLRFLLPREEAIGLRLDLFQCRPAIHRRPFPTLPCAPSGTLSAWRARSATGTSPFRPNTRGFWRSRRTPSRPPPEGRSPPGGTPEDRRVHAGERPPAPGPGPGPQGSAGTRRRRAARHPRKASSRQRAPPPTVPTFANGRSPGSRGGGRTRCRSSSRT